MIETAWSFHPCLSRQVYLNTRLIFWETLPWLIVISGLLKNVSHRSPDKKRRGLSPDKKRRGQEGAKSAKKI
jgi:hypothetical protein